MSFRHLVPALCMAISLPACGPESMLNPASEVPVQAAEGGDLKSAFVRDLRGCRIDYRDNHGENVYKLSKVGTYTFTSISRNRKSIDERQGLYIYTRTGKKTGRLIFDLTDTWDLTFVSPHRATAKNDGDARTYTFEFEWQ